MMDRVTMFARLSLCVLLLLSLWYGAHGARMLSARVKGELPPCKDVPGGIPNWDCFDPPLTPLPPCDFNHQNPAIDCSTDSQIPNPPPVPKVKAVTDTQSDRAQKWPDQQLPPCNLPGAIPGWDCFDPPTHDLPPCDYKHQRPGIDCWPMSPPAAKVTKVRPVADISPTAGGASAHDVQQSTATPQSSAHHVEGMLPPCKDVPGGIQNWDCYDPPSTPLPPCDFKHQNPGTDCTTDSQIPKSPPASKLAKAVTDISAAGDACAGSDCWPRVPWPGALP